MLAIPTTITDTLDCQRRAVIKNRLGSTPASSKALLLGTLRHELFEFALKHDNLSLIVIEKQVKKILRKEAEKLVCCKMSALEGERELLNFWPQVKAFKRAYFGTAQCTPGNLEGIGQQPGLEVSITRIIGVEEEVTSHELGMKGNLDALVEAITGTSGMPKSKTVLGIELKTNHRTDPQNKHVAQLAFYTIMLLARNGHSASENTFLKRLPENFDAIAGAMLLYVNSQSRRALHVAPQVNEIKSLVEQRNTFCSQAVRASKPRGVSLSYEDEDSPPK
jgi:DNA replication ATP-dependent helicase Dna2